MRSSVAMLIACSLLIVGACSHTSVEPSGSRGATAVMKGIRPSVIVGEAVPDFRMARADGSGHVRISDSKGKRPIFLVFGSWT